MLVAGCGAQIDQSAGRTTPAPATPLPRGVYSGTETCDVRVTSPSGEQSILENTLTITFEFNERGVPIVLGEEIRVGRTVSIGNIEVMYTRIESTETGVITHANVSGHLDSVSFAGSAIAELTITESGAIEYDFTQTWIDTDGFGYNLGCTYLLE